MGEGRPIQGPEPPGLVESLKARIEELERALREQTMAATCPDSVVSPESAESHRQTREQLDATLNALPDLMFEVDRDGRIHDFRAPHPEILYTEPKNFLGRTMSEVLPAEAGRVIEAALAEAVETGRHQGATYSLDLPEGTSWFELSIAAKGNPRTSEGRLVVLVRDITARRKAEAALRESEERFSDLANHIAEVFWISAPHLGRVIYTSPAYEIVWGRSSQPMFDDPETFFEAVHPEDRSLVRDAIHRHSEGQQTSIEYRIIRPDGTIRWLWDRAFPILDEQGRVLRIVGVASDITDRRRAEEERDALNAQFLQAQKMEAIGRLAGGIAHDMNNLLTVLMANGEFARRVLRRPGDPKAHAKATACLKEIEEAAERGAELIRQILTFSRTQVPAVGLIDVSKVVEGLGGMLRRLIGEDIEVQIHAGSSTRRVRLEQSRLEQALMNLAINARDAMPKGGRLTIEVTEGMLAPPQSSPQTEARPAPHLIISVADTGVGMDAEVRGHLFEPFFTTKPAGKGTGLGLATVYGIVHQAGGHVTVDSEPGRGSTFRLCFPAVLPEPVEIRRKRPARVTGGNETILLCEDEALVRRVLQSVLAEAGYNVIEAADGPSALAAADAHSGMIHLLVTDVVMPRMNGLELAAALHKARPKLLVLFVSGHASELLGNQAMPGDGWSMLQKPFKPDELLRQVRAMLDQAESSPAGQD